MPSPGGQTIKMPILNQQGTILSDRSFRRCLAVVLTALSCGCATFATAQTVSTVTGNPRVDKLLSQMTLEEKIAMVHGTGSLCRQMLPSIHATAKVKNAPNRMEGRTVKRSL